MVLCTWADAKALAPEDWGSSLGWDSCSSAVPAFPSTWAAMTGLKMNSGCVHTTNWFDFCGFLPHGNWLSGYRKEGISDSRQTVAFAV